MTDAHQSPQGFEMMRRPWETCIYRPESPLDSERLENQIRDPFVGFKGYRVCHHHDTACCRGFWERYKDEFQLGQLAQRLDAVVFVEPAK